MQRWFSFTTKLDESERRNLVFLPESQVEYIQVQLDENGEQNGTIVIYCRNDESYHLDNLNLVDIIEPLGEDLLIIDDHCMKFIHEKIRPIMEERNQRFYEKQKNDYKGG